MERARSQAPPLRTPVHLGSTGSFTRLRNRCSSNRARLKTIGHAGGASVRFRSDVDAVAKNSIVFRSYLHLYKLHYSPPISYLPYIPHSSIISIIKIFDTWTVSTDSLHTWHLSPLSSSSFHIFNLQLTAPNQTFRTIFADIDSFIPIHSILSASILLYTWLLTSRFLASSSFDFHPCAIIFCTSLLYYTKSQTRKEYITYHL